MAHTPPSLAWLPVNHAELTQGGHTILEAKGFLGFRFWGPWDLAKVSLGKGRVTCQGSLLEVP